MNNADTKTPWNQPIPEAYRPPQEFTAAVDAEIDRLAKEKDAWLGRIMKFYIPPEKYAKAYGSDKERKRLAKWIEKHKFHLREHPDGLTQFCKDEQVLAEFKIEFKK